MPISQRRKTVARVVPHVLGIPNANASRIEQSDDQRNDFLARQSCLRKIAAKAATQTRQCLREFDHPVELRTVADLPPLRVIAILLSAASVPSRRLQMTTGIATN